MKQTVKNDPISLAKMDAIRLTPEFQKMRAGVMSDTDILKLLGVK